MLLRDPLLASTTATIDARTLSNASGARRRGKRQLKQRTRATGTATCALMCVGSDRKRIVSGPGLPLGFRTASPTETV